MKVHLKTLGCRLNEAELENWAQTFQRSGHQITRQANTAEVVVINSCAVTQDAVRKSRQLIRRIHRENPSAKLVVSGCYATLNESEAATLLGVDLVINNQNKHQLVEKTLTELNLDTMPALSTEPGETALFTLGRQRAFVKVQDGCRYRCTFCIVTVARGDEQSRSIADVVQEINTLHEQGIQEVVLTGVHLGGYGSDLETNLLELIKTLLTKTQIPRIRLGSLEPWDLSEDFFTLFANPRLMPHLHLPLQSGSNTVLRRMARRCKRDDFSALVQQFRQTVPHFNVTTDIIVGFPGETEQEWQESLDFIREIGFGHLHIFSYSKREGTKAASLPNQVSDEIKKQRSRQLHELAATMQHEFWQQHLGCTFPILWEGYTEDYADNKKLAFGYTPNYLRVSCVIGKETTLANQTLSAQLKQTHKGFILADLTDAPSQPTTSLF